MTLTGDAPTTSARTETQRPETGVGRFEQWRAGWRVALRMARRDVRRHRGRSLLIVIMVGLPVLLLTAGSTLWFTDNLDRVERLPFQLGQTQGYLLDKSDIQVAQFIDPMSQMSTPEGTTLPPAKPVPGVQLEQPIAEREAALEALLQADLHLVTSTEGNTRVGQRWINTLIVGADLSKPAALAPRLTLDSGRWPKDSTEIVVTEVGAAHGLPTSGTVEVHLLDPDGTSKPRTMTIVGVGRAYQAPTADTVWSADLVTLPLTDAFMSKQWLVDRAEPITWGEVERLNTYGIPVYSRDVALHPETVTRRSPADEADNRPFLVIGASSLGLLLLTTLLAGPAFAVSAARQRRTLALAASNGATSPQLRRTVLAQAVVLGALSAVVGAVIGVVAGTGIALSTHVVRPDLMFGPIQIPWPAVALVAVAAIISSIIAAVIPSRGLGELDIVSVLRGQSVSPVLRRRVPIAGAVLVAVGTLAVLWCSYRSDDWVFIVFLVGCLALVIGALMMVPLVLALGARLAHRLPLPFRMAAREAGRQRGRATPTVAAIMGGAAVLAVVCIALQGDTLRAAKQYAETVRPGQALVTSGTARPDLDDAAGDVRRTNPAALPLILSDLMDYGSEGKNVILVAKRPGCTTAESIGALIPGDGISITGVPPCATLATSGFTSGHSLAAAPLADLSAFLELSPEQRSAMSRGGLAIVDPTEVAGLAKPSLQVNARTVMELRPVDVDVNAQGAVTFVRYPETTSPDGSPAQPDPAAITEVSMPVVHLSQEQWTRLVVSYSGGPGGIMTTETAAKLGIRTSSSTMIVRAPGGFSREAESELNDAIRARAPDASFTVERGYERSDTLMLLILFAVIGLIILVATLIATALSQAENAPLLGTLAAVGATRRTRRALAGAQALYLGLLGAGLGAAVGIIPGVAVSRVLSASYSDTGMDVTGSIIQIPWLQVLGPVVLVPLVGGLLAWVSIRRAPMVTRRAA